MHGGKSTMLVVATTYPRWSGDRVPLFVHDLSMRMTDEYSVIALVPHYKGAKTRDVLDGVQVHRFRYAPESLEVLCYEGGMISALKANPMIWAMLPFFVASFLFSYITISFKYKVVLVHCHWLIPLCPFVVFMRNLFGLNQKIVVTVHGGDIFAFRSKLGLLIKKYSVLRADRILAVSLAVKKEIVRLVGHVDKLSVLSMGVDKNYVALSDGDRKGILFVGRMVEKKGLPVLIEAVAKLKEKGINVMLRLAGDGPLKAQTLELVKEYNLINEVEFLGWVDKEALSLLYSESSIVVVPSIEAKGGDSEGLGLVVVEAICNGAILIASDLPAFSDVVKHGETGLLFTAGSIISLVEAIEYAMCNEARLQNIISRNRSQIADVYSWEVVAEKHKKIFKNT